MTLNWMSQERSIVLIRRWAMNRKDRKRGESPVRIIDTSLFLAIRGLLSSLFVLYVSELTACKTSSATWGWREDRVSYSSRTRDYSRAKWIMLITLHYFFFSYSILYRHPHHWIVLLVSAVPAVCDFYNNVSPFKD